MGKLKKLFEKFVNRETISYIIVGVLTTAVNWAVYSVCYNQLHIPNLVSTWIAWFLSVAFAFVPNRKLVFNSKNKGAAAILREILAFFGSRIFTQLIDTLGMWLMVDLAHFNADLSKLAVNVLVIIANYILGKFYVFKANSAGKQGESD